MDVHDRRTYVVTGADSGIGALTAQLLQRRGARVIRCGLADDVDVRADLGDPEGREALVREVARLAPNGIDGLALVAGIGAPASATVRVNYFGTMAALTGLRPLLLKSDAPRATLISSASSLSSGDADIVAAALRDDENSAIAAAERAIARGRGGVIYRSTKIALNRWVRRHAGGAEWAGSGIPLNVIAPGIVDTETVRGTMLADSAQAKILAEALPQPLGFPGPVEAVAEAVAWTLAPANSFMAGQIIFVDGGADTILRGDQPYAEGVRYGPLAMARMIYWSLRVRARGRKA
ncbi:SDR family oxidoreductase [Nocardia sp. NBC_01329]|uniref:SDR family oxidoreductase n=1 Tax=Nocardia sp. NBC_01329 TaxID=2903594 RepID=UPI002E0EF01F|nr:SDR family oxidoreductase [Nocardia sp. NBC_01329]